MSPVARRAACLAALLASLAASASPPLTAHLATAPSLRELARLDNGGRFVAFTRDGSRLLTADDHAARLWDARTFKPLGPALEHGDGLRRVDLSADGTKALTVGPVNGARSAAKLWDTRTGTLLLPPIRRQPAGDIINAALSPDGSLIAITEGTIEKFSDLTDPMLRLYDATTGKAAGSLKHDKPVRHVQFDPTGRTLVTTGDDVTTVWDLATRTRRATLPGNSQSFYGVPAITPDGQRLALLTDAWFEVYDLTTCRKLASSADHFLHLDEFMWTVDFSADGSRIVTTCTTGGAVWNAATGDPLLNDIDAFNGHPALSPDGTLAVFAAYKQHALWQVRPPKPLATLDQLNTDVVAFSPDGKRLAVAAYHDETVILDLTP